MSAWEGKSSHLRGVKERDGKEKDAWTAGHSQANRYTDQQKVLAHVGDILSYASSLSSNYLFVFTGRVKLPLKVGYVGVVKGVCSSLCAAISRREEIK